MNKPLKGKIDITRPQRHDGVDVISIAINDDLSGVRFLDIKMSPHDFMMAITGLSGQPIEFEVRNLDVIGKRKEYVRAEADVPRAELPSYDKKLMQDWLVKNQQREGWRIDTYLGAQSSVSHIGDSVRLRYGYYRYVDPEPS